MSIRQNTENLRELLTAVQNLPEASSGENVKTCTLRYDFLGTILLDRYVNGKYQHVYYNTNPMGDTIYYPTDIETGEVVDNSGSSFSQVVCGSIVAITSMSFYIVSATDAELLYTQELDDDTRSIRFFRITAPEGATARIIISYPG